VEAVGGNAERLDERGGNHMVAAEGVAAGTAAPLIQGHNGQTAQVHCPRLVGGDQQSVGAAWGLTGRQYQQRLRFLPHQVDDNFSRQPAQSFIIGYNGNIHTNDLFRYTCRPP
jgi:hypothetical protein